MKCEVTMGHPDRDVQEIITKKFGLEYILFGNGS